jgi:hypothetical protein
MFNEASDPSLQSLISEYDRAGGVLDYVLLTQIDSALSDAWHRAAALAGMTEIRGRCGDWLHWNEAMLTGQRITFATFWGTDDVEPKQISDRAWSTPAVDGYKTAFFHPPHGLHIHKNELADLFGHINEHVLGTQPQQAEIFSWSTNWSNYFDAGHEWWGTFYWTIRQTDAQRIVVIGASATD